MDVCACFFSHRYVAAVTQIIYVLTRRSYVLSESPCMRYTILFVRIEKSILFYKLIDTITLLLTFTILWLID